MYSPTMALGHRTDRRLSMPTLRICISPKVTGPNPENLSPLADRHTKSAGRPTDRCCALRCSIPKATRILYGKLNLTEPICIPCFRVGAHLPQNATVSGPPTQSTSFLVPHTVIRPGLPSMSGLFGGDPGCSRGPALSQHS